MVSISPTTPVLLLGYHRLEQSNVMNERVGIRYKT